MKKLFEIPELEVVRFVEADVVICSGCSTCNSDDGQGCTCDSECSTYWSSYNNDDETGTSQSSGAQFFRADEYGEYGN